MRNCYKKNPFCSAPLFLQLLLFATLLLPLNTAFGQGFQHGYDESNNRETGSGVDADGTGYIFSGTIDSPTDPADILLSHGDPNVLLNNSVRIKDGNSTLPERGFDVKAAPQGAYIIAGETETANQVPQAMLTQVSTQGNVVQWCATYPNTNFPTSFRAVAPMGNSGYVAAGYTGNPLTNGADTDMLISLISNNTGSVLAGNSFGGVGNEVANDVIALSNGQYLAVGSTESFGAVGKAFYLVLIDSTGNKVWSRIVDGPGDEVAYSAVEDAFGLVIVGQSTSFNSNGRTNIMLSRFNFGGLYLASNIYENPNYEEGARTVAFLGANDGYLLGGTTLGADSLAWLMRLSVNFTPTWFMQYENMDISDVQPAGNTYVGIGSHVPTGAVRNDLYIVHADNAGGTGSSCQPLALTPTNTIVQPTTGSGQDTTQVVNSVTMLNCTSTPVTFAQYDACTFVGIKPGLPGRVSIYPNPAAGPVAVDFAFDGLRNTVIEVYDLQGRSLMQQDLGITDRGLVRLDLTSYPAGTYLMRIRGDKDVWTRKIVKE